MFNQQCRRDGHALLLAGDAAFSGSPKYSLQLIMARLPKGAETTISMAFLVMCAEKILRLLCLFFVTFNAWICACQPVGWLLVALRKILPLETAKSLVTA